MWHHKVSLKSIFILIIALLFLSTAVSVLLVFYFFQASNTYKINLYNLQAEAMESSVNQRLRDYSVAMDTVALNPIIRDNIFRNNVDDMTMTKTAKEMDGIINSTVYLLTKDVYLDRYAFFTYLPGDGRYFLPLNAMPMQSWYGEYISAGGGTNSTFINFESNSLYKGKDIIQRMNVVRTINSFNLTTLSGNNDSMCYQVMTVNLQGIFEQQLDFEQPMSVHVFNAVNGTTIYSNRTELEDKAKEIYLLAKESKQKNYSNYENSYLQKAKQIPMAGYSLDSIGAYMVLAFDPVSSAPRTANLGFVSMLFAVLIFVVLAMLLIAFYLNYRNQVNSVVTFLDKMGDTPQPPPLPAKIGSNEIERIEKHVNLMQNRIHTLIDEEYKMKLQKISAQYEALTACINPHFLYNTLNSISAMAAIEDAEDTNRMIMALRDMFQYTSDMSQRFVSLEMELKNISDYLYIQGIRYNDSFSYRVDMNDGLMKCRVPKLILQPLVENCFKHGFEKKTSSGKEQKNEIQICIVRENEVLKIYVMDNGGKVTDKKLQEINASLCEKGVSNRSQSEIGLVNVHRRLQILYGDEFGLKLSCSEDNYTCVEVRIAYSEED